MYLEIRRRNRYLNLPHCLLFAIINIPQKYIKKNVLFPQFRPIRILLHIFGKKNRNKRLLIGLRKSYSVYKIGGIFMASLLIYIFFTSNGGDQRFFFGTATLLWKHRTLLTHFWDIVIFTAIKMHWLL